MTPPDPAPRLAIVVPVFRHSVLLAEALDAALAQEAPFGIRVVVVNDGCPHAETDRICRDFALAWPDRVTYLRKPNGGLSDARNHGIRHVLDHLPSVEAVYLLDADNRLRPQAMARAMAELDAHPEAHWIYPNIDMFGQSWAGDYGGDYSVLIHTAMNTCEAGSLVRAEVFRSGVMFDTGFRQGFEDWDFFLCAAEAGFRGRNLEHFGFLYRKRPESMLADSERDRTTIQGALRQKHKRLMQPASLLALEQAEAPRFAIVLADRGEVILATDPVAPGARTLAIADFEAALWRHAAVPGRFHLPPVVLVTTSGSFAGLRAAGNLHWALWKIEALLDQAPMATLAVETLRDRARVAIHDRSEGRHLGAAAVAIGLRLLGEVMRDSSSIWIDTLVRPDPEPPLRHIALGLPAPAADDAARSFAPTAVFDFLSIVHRLRASPLREAAGQPWDWRLPDIPWRDRTQQILREPFSGAPAFPRLPDGRRHVGFVLPLIAFGGVEKVALHVARALRRRGWVPHAFVLGADHAELPPDWRETFESVSILADPGFQVWGGGRSAYLGTEVPGWATGGEHGRILGALHWLDAVLNFHGGAVAAVMGQLRRLGVLTAQSLHLNDLTPFGRPVGNTYLGLAYEHAFDLFLPCSLQLADWLHGMGVPGEKIVPVPNAPGFEADPAALDRDLAARRARDPAQPLRVMYLGRLDRQKGLDRLTALIRASARAGLDLQWRLIGKSVVGDGAPPIPSDIAGLVEPPLSRPADLSQAYAWADVVVLLSGYEGLPLTVLEAMRAGAVPLCTDVGAVSEVVRDGENGLLVDPGRAVPQALGALTRLAADRSRLRALSAQAAADMAGRDWDAAVEMLAERLERHARKAASALPAVASA